MCGESRGFGDKKENRRKYWEPLNLVIEKMRRSILPLLMTTTTVVVVGSTPGRKLPSSNCPNGLTKGQFHNATRARTHKYIYIYIDISSLDISYNMVR